MGARPGQPQGGTHRGEARPGAGNGRGARTVDGDGRRGGDEDDGEASRRRGSGVGRGEGKGIEGEGEGERGDRFGPGIGEGEGTILMAHHPSMRHKYIHTNGAPHPGAPLVFFFISARANRLSSTLPDPHQVPSTSSTGQQPVLTPGGPGFDSQAPQFFLCI